MSTTPQRFVRIEANVRNRNMPKPSVVTTPMSMIMVATAPALMMHHVMLVASETTMPVSPTQTMIFARNT